jgi:hypothetical protein
MNPDDAELPVTREFVVEFIEQYGPLSISGAGILEVSFV